jgi:phosphinothricin acetyltransferase
LNSAATSFYHTTSFGINNLGKIMPPPSHQLKICAVQIRPAQDPDLPQIRAINAHYILHTALTFAETPPPHETYRAKFTDLVARGLPYLVAVAEDSANDELFPRARTGNQQVVLCYAYLSPFRGHLTAYAPTVELSLFLHPAYHSQGIGTKLLAEIVTLLRERNIHHVAIADESASGSGDFGNNCPISQTIPPTVTVENIVAVMAVDPEGKDQGEALRRWYIKRGFQECGGLSRVGFKRGHWYI